MAQTEKWMEELIVDLIDRHWPHQFVSDEKLKRDWLPVIADHAPAGGYTPQWIPVIERLPEDGTDVLLLDIDGNLHLARYRTDSISFRYDCDSYDVEAENASCWIAQSSILPQPAHTPSAHVAHVRELVEAARTIVNKGAAFTIGDFAALQRALKHFPAPSGQEESRG